MLSNEFLALVFAGDAGALRDRLSAGASPNSRDARGWTPLMFAAMSGKTEIVELLLSAGADVNARAADGSSALLEAALWRHDDVVELLLKSGADPDSPDDQGWTARQICEQRNVNERRHNKG
jgi:ankyrin repeat protein